MRPITQLTQPVCATVSMPGSKSYTNRALLLAAMTKAIVRIERPLLSDDTEAMLRCLKALGVQINQRTDAIEVVGDVFNLDDREYRLDVNQSGLTMRFLVALCAAIPGVQTIGGKPSLNKRPIRELVDGLRQVGASIEYLEHEGFPPVRVTSSKLRSGTVTMRGDVSSQYSSALMQVATLISGDLLIKVEGEQVSRPYIDMTIDTMRTFGVTVSNQGYKEYRITGGQQYRSGSYKVEGDVSSAAYFWAIAALTRSTITTTNINPRSKQADIRFLEILRQMDAEVTLGPGSVTVAGKGVKNLHINMADCPDQAMTLAVLAAFAPGTTTIDGIASLRVKESDRVLAVATELQKMGIACRTTTNRLTITGGKPKPATIDTYEDHRIAMSFAVAGTALPGMRINNPEVVNKTFPEFWKILAEITDKSRTNIVLVGMRGSGKTTVGRLLAKRLGRRFVDTDELVAQAAGQDIPEIVAAHGWEHFRNLESVAVQTAANERGAIIATGGGAILRPRNIATLKACGSVVQLTADIDTIVARIADNPSRPRLTGQASLYDEIRELWAQRGGLYRRAADCAVGTTNRTPEVIADEIITKLNLWKG